MQINHFKHLIFLIFLSWIAIENVAIAATSEEETNENLSELTITKAEQLFAKNNREILAAKRNVEGAEADSISLGQKPNPTLSINATNLKLTQSNGSGGLLDKTIDTVVRVDQLIERGNKREIRMAAAKEAISASQNDLQDTTRQQLFALRSAYYDVEAAQEKLKIQQDNVALYAKTLNAANLRLSAGDIASADVSRIHVDALRAENDLRQAQADLEKAQTFLAYFIGKEKQARQIKVSESWPEIQPQSSSESIESLIAQRPDVQAAEARIRLSDQGRNLAQSLKTRDITVGMQYEHFPQDSKNTIGGGISIPLFTNYEFQGEIARSEVNYTAALESREQIQAQAIGEIEKARADLEATTDRVNRFNTVILNEAEKSANAAEFAYQHGAMGVLDLLDARRTLRSLQLEAATAKADYAKSLAAWHAALSGETNK